MSYSERYQRLKAEGRCTGHAKRRSVNGTTKCAECLVKKGASSRQSRVKNIERGKCVSHHERPAVVGRTKCKECLETEAGRRAKAKAAGKCTGHPERDVEPGRTKCLDCLIAFRCRSYGITPEEFFSLEEKQGGVCAICKQPERRFNGGRLCVDHCHATKRVRGLLCNVCNTFLGALEKKLSYLYRYLEYLNTK